MCNRLYAFRVDHRRDDLHFLWIVFGLLEIWMTLSGWTGLPGMKAGLDGDEANVLQLTRGLFFLSSLVLVGLYRNSAFHPVFLKDYRIWLESTPWTAEKELPLGPVHLTWRDAGIVLLLVVASILLRVALERIEP